MVSAGFNSGVRFFNKHIKEGKRVVHFYFFCELDLLVYAVEAVEEDVDGSWFGKGGKTIIYVTREKTGLVRFRGDCKCFVNDVVHDYLNEG